MSEKFENMHRKLFHLGQVLLALIFLVQSVFDVKKCITMLEFAPCLVIR